MQLQRGSQSGVGGGLTTGGAGPLLPGHIPPSTLGTIPPSSSIGLEKNTPDQYDAIQSLMSQLTKMQMQGPENLQVGFLFNLPQIEVDLVCVDIGA